MAQAIRRFEGEKVNYTPGGAIAAGDVVIAGDIVGVAEAAIPANELGAISIKGVFEMPKTAGDGTALTYGQTVAWDDTNNIISGTLSVGRVFGRVARAAADADTTVYVLLLPGAVGSQAATIAALTDSSAGTANATVQAMPDPTDAPATADALRDDLVATLLPAIRNNFADVTAKINAIIAALKNAGIVAAS